MSEYFRGKALSSSAETALLHILMNGPTHGYDLIAKASLNTNTAYAGPKALKKMGLLKVRDVEGKSGQRKTMHFLTLAGLCVALDISDEAWSNMDLIVKIWKDFLHFPFEEKWTIFRKHEFTENIKDAFKREVEIFYGIRINSVPSKYKFPSSSSPPDIDTLNVRKRIEDLVIDRITNSDEVEQLIKWYKILSDDPELRKKAIRCLKEWIVAVQDLEKRLKKKEIMITKLETMILQNLEPDWKEIEKLESDAQRAKIRLSDPS